MDVCYVVLALFFFLSLSRLFFPIEALLVLLFVKPKQIVYPRRFGELEKSKTKAIDGKSILVERFRN